MTTTGSRSLRASPGSRYSFIAVIPVAVSLRLALLLAFGPRPSHDSVHGYVPFAHLIRDGTRWVSDAGLTDFAVPITTFRMIGYPALIALSDSIAGDRWPWLLVFVQIAASVAAIVSVMLLAQALEPTRRWVAIAAGLAVAFGQTLGTDTAIQTDSLSAATLVGFATFSARGALQRRRIGPVKAIGLGLLPAASFLLRENTDLTVLTILPFAMAWIARAAPSHWRRLCLALLVVMPLIVANSAQVLWNTYRTGSSFVTTGTQTILLQALLHAAWTGVPVFDGGEPIDRAAGQILTAKEHPTGLFTRDELLAVNQRLFDGGANAIRISRQMIAAYEHAWLRYPLGMFRATIGDLSGELFFLLGNGLRVNMSALFVGPPGRGDIDPAGLVASLSLCGISLAITVSFLFSPFAAIYRALVARQPFSEADWFRLAVLVASLSFLWLHAMVHFEDRYLAPVEPLAIIGGLTGLARAWARFDRARGRAAADPTPGDRPGT